MKNNSRIAINPWSIEPRVLTGQETFEETVERIAKMGIKLYDLEEYYLGFNPHANLYKLHQMKKFLNSFELSIAACYYETQLFNACELFTHERVAETMGEYIAIAAELESPYIVILNGYLMDGMSAEYAHGSLLKAYEMIVKIAESYNVQICIEGWIPDDPLRSIENCLSLVKEFDSKYIRLCPDFNSFRVKEGVTPESLDVLKKSLPYVPYVHAKFLSFDETGTDPGLPMDEMMSIFTSDSVGRDYNIEYEGWVYSDRLGEDPWIAVEKGVSLLQRYLD